MVQQLVSKRRTWSKGCKGSKSGSMAPPLAKGIRWDAHELLSVDQILNSRSRTGNDKGLNSKGGTSNDKGLNSKGGTRRVLSRRVLSTSSSSAASAFAAVGPRVGHSPSTRGSERGSTTAAECEEPGICTICQEELFKRLDCSHCFHTKCVKRLASNRANDLEGR
jgi:hypothetical protein